MVVLPVPFERTTSYGKGTSAGPAALLRASQSMELYDDELGCEPCEIGIATAPPFHPEAFDMEEAMAELDAECHRFMEAGKFLVTLGGEHSLTIAPVRAAQRVFGEIGIVQFDAHADLREEFEGTPYSHASVMRRVFDEGIRSLPVGIRSLSAPEAELIERHRIPVLWGRELEPAAALEKRFEALLKKLPKKIYLTFDIDYFDPALVPCHRHAGARRRQLVSDAAPAAEALRDQGGRGDGHRRAGTARRPTGLRLRRREARLQVHRLQVLRSSVGEAPEALTRRKRSRTPADPRVRQLTNVADPDPRPLTRVIQPGRSHR